MEKYRKKPVIIEAAQFNENNANEIKQWAESYNYFIKLNYTNHKVLSLNIKTLEGVMQAELGDWIIKGINNEFYSCKNDIFEKTYEKAS